LAHRSRARKHGNGAYDALSEHAISNLSKWGQDVTEARLSTRRANLMLAFLSLSYGLAFFDRLLMAVVGEMVKTEFQLSDKMLSLLTGAAFVIIYGACGIIAGWATDRFSRKRILSVALVVWSLMTMACGLAASFVTLALARAGVGIGEAAIVPVGQSSIGDLYAPEKRPMAVAIFFTGGMIGILACFLIGSWVATHYGWRTAFLLAGPPGLIVALLIARFAVEPVRERIEGQPDTPEGSTFRQVWENKPLIWLLVGGSLATYINLGLISWLPNFFIRSHGLSVQQVGLFFGPVLAGGMTVGMLAGGWLGNRIATKSLVGLIQLSTWVVLLLVPLYLLIFWLPTLGVALTATFIGAAISALYTPSFTAAWQKLCTPQVRGTAAGLSSFGNAIIGTALCTFLVGMMSDYWMPTLGKHSLRAAMTAGLIFPLASAMMLGYAARRVARCQPPAS
jgi:predicted MFS family arabinose efflux permease